MVTTHTKRYHTETVPVPADQSPMCRSITLRSPRRLRDKVRTIAKACLVARGRIRGQPLDSPKGQYNLLRM